MTKAQYFECQGCGQVVQGWGASRDIDCCDQPDFVEIYGPQEEPELQIDLADFLQVLKPSLLTKWGNYRKPPHSDV